MESLTKNQILSKTNCTFYVWTPNVESLVVTKRALRCALKSSSYRVYSVVGGIIGHGKHEGEDWMVHVIMI